MTNNDDDLNFWNAVCSQFTNLSNCKRVRFDKKIITDNDPTSKLTIVEVFKPKLQNKVREIDPNTKVQKTALADIKKIKRNQIHINKVLDLHGFTKVQAYDKLLWFIKYCYTYGFCHIIVITGKGTHGATQHGVLKNMFLKCMQESQFKPYIISYSKALPRHGGDGAFYVFLRKKKD